MVATDGHRLALSVRTPGRGRSTCTGIVPRKAVAGDRAHRGRGRGGADRDQREPVHAPDAELLLTARLIEGTFPNYERWCPRAHPHRVSR